MRGDTQISCVSNLCSWGWPHTGSALQDESVPPASALAGFAGVKLKFPLPKEQAALKRRAGSIRARLLEESKRKTRQAERMLGNAAALSSSTKKKSKEAELMAKENAKVRFRTAALLATAYLPFGVEGCGSWLSAQELMG